MRQAREAGWTWAQIATALGMSPLAVHQRRGPRLAGCRSSRSSGNLSHCRRYVAVAWCNSGARIMGRVYTRLRILVGVDERTASERVAGDLLRLARVKAGLTQTDLAVRAGVAQTLISAYENGHRQPTLPTLMRLLEAAGLELRMRLEPPDSQRQAVDEWEATRPAAERKRWAREQARVAARR